MALTQHTRHLMRHIFRNIHSSRRVICSTTFQTKLYYCNQLDATNTRQHFSVSVPKENANTVKVTFVRSDGQRITVDGKIGDNLLDVVINNNVDLDGFGACEGTLACSTCHLIFSKKDYDKIPDKPTDEELDMLDLASELTDTSRLGCQVFLTKDFDGLEVRVPSGVNDART